MIKSPKILIAMAGFKGSLTNFEACDAVASAARDLSIPFVLHPVGDGGRGTMKAWALHHTGEFLEINSTGPFGEKVIAQIYCMPSIQNPTSLYVESSETCGWVSGVKPGVALQATSLGLGTLLKQCLEQFPSLKEVFVGLGDSAISDGGVGMLAGLGFRFFDNEGKRVEPITRELKQIANWKTPTLPKVQWTILCDVQNPMTGPEGSARVFSPQKGATPEEVTLIEKGLENWAGIIGKNIALLPMTGSAGALSSAFLGFLGAQLVPGASFLLSQTSFSKNLDECSILITGEGKTDRQTAYGKAPRICIESAFAKNLKTILISGALEPGCEELGSLFGTEFYASGKEPTAKQALYQKALQVLKGFS